uniref:Uncharacterized protein n=1 Tax=Physcomitrium patens TaxID=3218 RepID=A0A2K1KJA1_PHYPA|nr:hypothetical protein PHYPA_007531 [Physcomitrium patens]
MNSRINTRIVTLNSTNMSTLSEYKKSKVLYFASFGSDQVREFVSGVPKQMAFFSYLSVTFCKSKLVLLTEKIEHFLNIYLQSQGTCVYRS